MKIALHALVAGLMAFVLFLPASMSAQKPPKAEAIELTAEFHVTDANGNSCKICMNDGHQFYSSNRLSKSYPNNVMFTTSGTLYMRIQRNQRVRFIFDTPARTYQTWTDGHLKCRAHGSTELVDIDRDPPAFLSANWLDSLFTQIVTGAQYEYKYDDATGSYKWTLSPTYFNLTDPSKLPVGGFAYVLLNIQLHTDVPDTYDVFHHSKLWETSPHSGIAKVTHPNADTWQLEPLPAGNPSAPLPALGPNQASLFTVESGDNAEHLSGYCDLGDWVMPFRLTLTALR